MKNPLPDMAHLLSDAVDRVAPSLLRVQAGDRSATGVVLDAEAGTLITTAHLFRRQRDAQPVVTLPDGSQPAATLLGTDDATDLAVVALEDATLTTAPTTDGSELRVAQPVLSVGRSDGDVRAAFGIVSALGDDWRTPGGGEVDRWISVDGGLPPGFSGGPLVDLAGRVVGVNTRGVIRSGTTLPWATVVRVAPTVRADGGAARGFLGVGLQPVALPDKVATAASQSHGLLVTWVKRGGPAAEAGVQVGDTLLSVDDVPLQVLPDLFAALRGKVGAEVAVRLARAGDLLTVTATPRERHRRGGGRWGQRRHGGPCR